MPQTVGNSACWLVGWSGEKTTVPHQPGSHWGNNFRGLNFRDAFEVRSAGQAGLVEHSFAQDCTQTGDPGRGQHFPHFVAWTWVPGRHLPLTG